MSDRPDLNKTIDRVGDGLGVIHPFKLIPDCGAKGGCALWRKVLTMEEAGGICCVDRSTLTRHAIAGVLRTHLIGERRLIDERDLAGYIDAGCCRQPGGGCKGGKGSDGGFSSRGFCVMLNDSERYICPVLLTDKEVANTLRIHRTTLAKFVSIGELPSLKLGRARRISAFDLWTFFDKRVDGKDASIGKEAC
jgi:excisionase family DNA binding protein